VCYRILTGVPPHCLHKHRQTPLMNQMTISMLFSGELNQSNFRKGTRMKAVFIGHHLSYHIKFIVCSCWASKVGQVFYYDVYTGKVFFVCITFITNCSTSFTKITIIKLFTHPPKFTSEHLGNNNYFSMFYGRSSYL